MLYDELRDRLEVERRGMTETRIDLIRWDFNFYFSSFGASVLQSEAMRWTYDCYVFTFRFLLAAVISLERELRVVSREHQV